MTGVITWLVDCGDGVCIGGNNPPPHFKPMTNIELTLDQLQAVSGGIIDGGCRPPIKRGTSLLTGYAEAVGLDSSIFDVVNNIGASVPMGYPI